LVVVFSALSTAGLQPDRSGAGSVAVLCGVLGLAAIDDWTRSWRYRRSDVASLRRTACLLNGDLRSWHLTQCAATTFASLTSFLWIRQGGLIPASLVIAFGALSFVAQHLLFFRAGSPDRMPQ
jgi:hypothetical protein